MNSSSFDSKLHQQSQPQQYCISKPQEMEEDYLQQCVKYQSKVDCGVIIILRYSSSSLSSSSSSSSSSAYVSASSLSSSSSSPSPNSFIASASSSASPSSSSTTTTTTNNNYYSSSSSEIVTTYKPSLALHDNDLIPIVNIFIKYGLTNIISYNFSNCHLTSNGIFLLYDLCFKHKAFIEKLELRNNALGDEGACVLAKILSIPDSKLKFLGLHWNNIGERGACALAEGLKNNYILEELDISHNSVGSHGARIIRKALLERLGLGKPPLTLAAPIATDELRRYKSTNDIWTTEMDSLDASSKKSSKTKKKKKVAEDTIPKESITGNGYHSEEKNNQNSIVGVMQNKKEQMNDLKHNISEHLSQLQSHIRNIHDKPVMHNHVNRSLEERFQLLIHLDGNFLKEEVLNSVTHGLGLILSILASVVLMRESYHRSMRCMFASSVYAFTLCFMYFSSTMYHSFFSFVNLKIAFRILDYSSIFLLISGTYTPMLLVALQHSPFHSMILLIVLWSVALMGVCYTAVVPPAKGNWKFFTTIFVGMSYGFLIAMKSFLEVSQTGAVVWLLIGGIFFTGGIYFLKQEEEEPIMHSAWHLFVLAGSLCHYICILCYIVPMDEFDVPLLPLTFQHVLDNLFMGLPLSHYLYKIYCLTLSMIQHFLPIGTCA